MAQPNHYVYAFSSHFSLLNLDVSLVDWEQIKYSWFVVDWEQIKKYSWFVELSPAITAWGDLVWLWWENFVKNCSELIETTSMKWQLTELFSFYIRMIEWIFKNQRNGGPAENAHEQLFCNPCKKLLTLLTFVDALPISILGNKRKRSKQSQRGVGKQKEHDIGIF